MAVTHDVRPLSDRRQEGIGPRVMFAAALVAAIAAWVVAARSFGADHPLPLVATLLFGLAALAALVAWSRGASRGLTYWDVAGALTFIGIGAAALIEPEQMLRLVATAPADIEAIGGRR